MKKSQRAIVALASLLVLSILGPVFLSIPPVNAAGDFSISASPSSGTVSAGSFFRSTVSVTSSGGFHGSVDLSSSVSPSTGTITASLSPTSVSVTPGAPSTSTLTVDTTPFTPLGTYTVTVTGTGGGLTHSTPVTVTVTSGTVGATAQPSPSLAALPVIELSILIAITGAALGGIALKRTRTASGLLA